ncbi:MAG: hypothetical protein ACXABY_34350 [Candidatus Thorarchaeota archaeon]|jgi:hypothetical protein
MTTRENSSEVAAFWIIAIFLISAALGSLLGGFNSGATIGLFLGLAGALFISLVNQFKWGYPTVSMVNRFARRVLAPLMLVSLAYLMISNLLSYLE